MIGGQTFTRQRRLAVGMVLSVLAVHPALRLSAWADDHPLTRATLKGVLALEVLVEETDEDAEKDGITRNTLQADVVQRLRQAGIPVVPSAMGQLYLNVNTYKSGTGLYAFAIALEFKQGVRLVRDPKIITFSPTWGVGSVGIAGSYNLSRNVLANVANHVEEFIKAYREQNPTP